MRKLKLYFILFSFIFLTGCFQSSALLGPGMTIISTGNVAQAGFQYGANTAIKNETGKDVLTHIKDKVDDQNKEKKFYVQLKELLENRIETTRQKLLSN